MMELVEISKRALPKVEEALKKKPESVSSLEKTEKGWRMEVQVLERKAVPDSFDLLSVFELSLDASGNVLGFKQIKKMRRGDSLG